MRKPWAGIEAYGVELPPATSHANAFYLLLFLDRCLARTGLQAGAFSTRCHEVYQIELLSGTRMYPPTGLPQGSITLARGQAHINTPGAVIYAPEFAATQRPFLRLSFGVEPHITEAAQHLRQACAETW